MKTLAHLSDYLDRLATAVKCIRFLALVGSVAIIGIGHYFRGAEAEWQTSIADTLFWIGLAVLLIANLLLVFVDRQPVEILKSLHEEEKRSKKREDLIKEYRLESEALTAWNTLTRFNSELLDQALLNPEMNRNSRSRVFEAAVEFIADYKQRLFGIEDDYLNISVYERSDADDELHCIACYRSRSSDAEGPHRSWKIGEGHVGKAFELKRGLVCADARKPDVAGWVAAPTGKLKDDDEKKYISLIAVPIAVDSDKPLGVIVVTSDRPRRFVNLSDVETESEAQRQKFAVESLQDIASQIAQLMRILEIAEDEEEREEERNGEQNT